MKEDNYLTDEEQYKETLNQEEIARIKDPILRDIRMKYWNKQLEIFLDEYGIPDSELEKESDLLIALERKEILKYKANRIQELK
jgi:hypothetical protein